MFQMLLLSDAFAFSASGILVYKGSGKRVVKDAGHLYVVSCGGVASLAEFVTLLTERETQCKWASRHSVSSKLLHLSEVQPAGSAAFHSSAVHGAEVSAPVSCADVGVLSMVLHWESFSHTYAHASHGATDIVMDLHHLPYHGGELPI